MEKTLSERELFNHVQKKVQAGYDVLGKDAAAACTYWLEAWKSVQQLFDQTKLKTVEEFDRRFKWSHFLSNWLQDLETELWNAGLDTRPLLQDRINFCENMLKRFPPAESPDLGSENLRRSLAETYFETGECEKAEQLFSAWLKDDPQWGWGWIGWSDLFLFSNNNKNLDKCEKILNEGLAIPEVRDHCDILERLSDVYSELGRHDESDKLRTQSMDERSRANVRDWFISKSPAEPVTSIDFAAMMREHLNQPAAAPKSKRIGRNDPCPCGSNKTYKKCCLKKIMRR